MDAPEASVVIATFNRAELLPKTLESVLSQKGVEFEVVVIDDCSSDGTPQVLSHFADLDDRLSFTSRKRNGGLSKARNDGIARATGEWVTFLDDDDKAEPNWLAHFSTYLGNPEVDVVCCGVTLETGDGAPEVRLPHPLGPALGRVTGLFVAGSFAVRRSLLLEIGGFESSIPTFHHSELALRLVRKSAERTSRIVALDIPLVRIHRGAPGERPMSQAPGLLKGAEFILREHRELVQRDPEMYANFSRVAGVSAARVGKYRVARRHFRRALWSSPLDYRTACRLAAATFPPLARILWKPVSSRGEA